MITHFIIVCCIYTKVTNSVPGFEYGDNRAAKYLTEDNGVAEITFQERIVNFSFYLISFNCSFQISFLFAPGLISSGHDGQIRTDWEYWR